MWFFILVLLILSVFLYFMFRIFRVFFKVIKKEYREAKYLYNKVDWDYDPNKDPDLNKSDEKFLSNDRSKF